MKLRVLSEADCRTLLGMRDAIDVQAEAFALLAGGHSVEGLRSLATSENPPGVAIFNPSFLRAAGGYGIKVISDFYENERHGLTRMTGIVALFDGTTGYPRTVMEAGYLTDLRTGAGTGLAARYLARKNSRIVTIIGAGRVARNQLEALAELFDIEVVHVATRSRTRGEEFVRRMRATCGRRIGEDSSDRCRGCCRALIRHCGRRHDVGKPGRIWSMAQAGDIRRLRRGVQAYDT